jgi:polysaccharide pyruvyl transferase WcaK-like protein
MQMTAVPRLLVIADVGGEHERHIGDEAMLAANLDALRALIPHVAFTIVSRDPVWVTQRYDADSVPLFGFPDEPSADAERASFLAHLLDATIGKKRHRTVDAVASADAVIVSGGGNLSSTWPHLLYERATLLQLARHFGKPAVVLGQTIGPRLEADQRRLLSATLPYARFVGVRDLPSAVLAIDLGVPHQQTWYQCDDAMFLDDAAIESRNRETIAVTIDPQFRATSDGLFASLVDQLRMLSDATGAPLTLVPHAFGCELSGGPSDLMEARVLAERIGPSRVMIAEGLDARETRRVTAGASLVVSSRYHPIVFGLAAGVPSLGIYGDDYCRIKLQGALAHARLDRWTLTYDDVARGALLPKALELWSIREGVQRDLAARRELWREEWRERWTAVLGALDPAGSISSQSSMLFGRPPDDVVPALASALRAQIRWSEAERTSLEARFRETEQHLQAELGPRRTLIRYASALRSVFSRSSRGRPK